MPPPIVESPPARSRIDGPLLSRVAICVRLAWAKRLETKRRRINIAKNQSMLVAQWPPLQPPSLPIATHIRAYTPPLPGSLHTFG